MKRTMWLGACALAIAALNGCGTEDANDVVRAELTRADAPTAVDPTATNAAPDVGHPAVAPRVRACLPMKARGVGPCDQFFGYRWDGERCAGVSGCSCQGPACKRLYKSLDVCRAKHARCRCAPMKARGVGLCDMLLGYKWDGARCVALSGCSCQGPACKRLYDSESACLKAHRGCGCKAIDKAYRAQLRRAKRCSPLLTVLQCTHVVKDQLACPCTTHVNPLEAAALIEMQRLEKLWQVQGCAADVVCPAMPCPPVGDGVCAATAADAQGSCVDVR